MYLTTRVGYSTAYMDFVTKMRIFSHSRFLRIVVIGGIGLLLQTALFEILGIYLQIFSPSTAVVIGAETAILVNFYLNNRFSFRDRQHDTSLALRLVRFHLVVSGSVVLQWLFVFIAEHSTSSYLIIHAAYIAGIIFGFMWNYTFYLLFVWKSKE